MKLLTNFFNDIKANYKTLILALALAIVFWIVVSVQVFPTVEDRINEIPIDIQPTDYMIQKNLQIVSGADAAVNIRIEGKRYDISGLNADDFNASVDLSNIRAAGSYTVPVNITCKEDKEYNLLDTDPLSITLVVDEIVTREFTINATAPDISLPDGYYADEITADPPTISLTGSASILDKITEVEARSTYHGEILESHETGSDILIYGANGVRIVADDITMSTDTVTVNIPIFKQKELPLVFTLANYAPNFDVSSLGFEIQPATITVAAPDDSIDYLSELNIGTIDISDIKINQVSIIPITLPNGYRNLSGNNNARITWNIDDYGKLDFTVDNLALANIPDNYDVSLITKEMTISIIGPSEDIAELSAGNVYCTVNLLGVALREGSQDVAVTVNISGSNQKCWVSGSYKATIYAQSREEQAG